MGTVVQPPLVPTAHGEDDLLSTKPTTCALAQSVHHMEQEPGHV